MRRKALILMTTILFNGMFSVFALAQQVSESQCASFSSSMDGISGSLNELLGPPKTCEVIESETSEFGLRETYQLSWSGVNLTIKSRLPETGIYVIETEAGNALPKSWFERMQSALIEKGWKDINWLSDKFPGPRAEHYMSRIEGHNAQVWLERDGSGDITWFRFSYAL